MQPCFTVYFFDIVMVNYTCQNKISADQYHVTISRAQVYSIDVVFFRRRPLTKCWFSIVSRVHVKLTCLKHMAGLFESPLTITQDYNLTELELFPLYKCFLLLFLCIWRLLTQNRKPNNIHVRTETSPQSSKLKSKFYNFLS